MRSLNGVLPHDVAVVQSSGHLTASMRGGTPGRGRYCYRVLAPACTKSVHARSRAVVVASRSTSTLSKRCAAALPGTHDFTAFTPTQTEHSRFERTVLRGRVAPRR